MGLGIGPIKEGGLHKSLGIPKGQDISEKDKQIKPGDSPLVKKQKILAQNFAKMRKK